MLSAFKNASLIKINFSIIEYLTIKDTIVFEVKKHTVTKSLIIYHRESGSLVIKPEKFKFSRGFYQRFWPKRGEKQKHGTKQRKMLRDK